MGDGSVRMAQIGDAHGFVGQEEICGRSMTAGGCVNGQERCERPASSSGEKRRKHFLTALRKSPSQVGRRPSTPVGAARARRHATSRRGRRNAHRPGLHLASRARQASLSGRSWARRRSSLLPRRSRTASPRAVARGSWGSRAAGSPGGRCSRPSQRQAGRAFRTSFLAALRACRSGAY